MARNVEQTKQELLAAATAEFAEHGLAGARVDRIAEAAGVNKQRIYGHFGSKDGLFDAVLARTMREAAASKPFQPGEAPGDYVARSFDFHHEHPELLQLLMWEALSRPVEAALSDAERRAHYDEKVQGIMTMADLDEQQARYALFTILAMTTYAHAFPQVSALVLGSEHTGEELRTKLAESVTRLVDAEQYSS